jgi:hypothetical protein
MHGAFKEIAKGVRLANVALWAMALGGSRFAEQVLSHFQDGLRTR